MHLASAVALGFVLLHNLSPEHTGGTELGDFHEVVLAHAHIELDALGSLSGIHASLGQDVQIFGTPCECITKFLIDVSTSIVQRYSVDIDALVAWQFNQRFNERLGAFEHGRHILALAEHLADGVEVDAALQLCQWVVLSLEVLHQDLCQFHAMTLASLEVQLHILRQDAVE